MASIATLGTGGSGGREGPTMQIGAALGSTVGRYLKVSARERRVLMVAGIAAGISAVFRTPLGAALIAIEMLYRDDFESEALIPAVLASVIAYSVSISVFGHATLFGHLQPFAFQPEQIPLYIVLAIVVSAGASLFVGSLRLSKSLVGKLALPEWARPALGGLLLGLFVVLLIHFVGPVVGRADRGLGDLRRRLWRRAGRDHRRGLAPDRVDRRADPRPARRDQDHRLEPDDRLGWQRG